MEAAPACTPVSPGMVNSHTVIERTGVTYRQLHYWCFVGWLGKNHQRPGSGYRVEYSPLDVELVEAVRDLHAVGFNCDKRFALSMSGNMRRLLASGAREMWITRHGDVLDTPPDGTGPAIRLRRSGAEVV